MAMMKFNDSLDKLSDPDLFHTVVSCDRTFINILNSYLKKYNIYIEYV